jgi:hypothetical protein
VRSEQDNLGLGAGFHSVTAVIRVVLGLKSPGFELLDLFGFK